MIPFALIHKKEDTMTYRELLREIETRAKELVTMDVAIEATEDDLEAVVDLLDGIEAKIHFLAE